MPLPRRPLVFTRPLRNVKDPAPGAGEPIRGELFGDERFEAFAAELALSHKIAKGVRPRARLLRRLDENARVLLASYRTIATAIRDERSISPAGEWLVDNFHIVEDQLREIRDDLPPSFYRQLPVLADGPLAGHPRIYGVASEYVAHSDSHVDLELLRRFVQAYQSVEPLTIGELWALPISLRLLLVENLRRLSDSIVSRRAARESADALADGLLGLRGPQRAFEEALAKIETARLPTAFIVRLLQRLREQEPARAPAIVALQERLTQQHASIDDLVAAEHQTQVATHVTVRNVITSMRLLSSADWLEFFDALSKVEEILRQGGRVAEMDFATRDQYRHAVEEIARGSKRSELEVAQRAVDRAKALAASATDEIERERAEDPGGSLIGARRVEFERELGCRPTLRQRVARTYARAGTLGYFGSVLALAASILALLVAATWQRGASPGTLATLTVLGLVPALALSITLINRHVLSVIKPVHLPRLELAHGIPAQLRTLVVVPTLLSSVEQAREDAARLEVHYLSNPDGDLRFALLSDGVDADTETLAEDEERFAAALEAILELNRVHGPMPDGSARFLLFHRRRKWNASEQRWMGWERKRGKLHELDRLLRGATDTSFVARSDAAAKAPSGVRFVITLDADTRLPIGSAKRLAGTLAHPLNRPRIDRESRRVVEGFGVLQPRVTAILPENRDGSLYQRIFAGPQGLDPYAFAVSDIYQDLFGFGIYTGKGIYDVDAFETALEGRAPENALLSHDLFEGLFARAGLVSDVELFDDFPPHYSSAAARTERWTRGDWQLLPWLGSRIFDAQLGSIRTPIPAIGRWQILDNLRRSVSAPASVLLLLAAWALPLAGAGLWTAFVVIVWTCPSALSLWPTLVPRRSGIGKRSFVRRIGEELTIAVSQAALSLVFLAHQAWLTSAAIVRTLARLVTRRRLLEWVSAAQAQARSTLELGRLVRSMLPALGIGVFALLATRPPNLAVAAPLVCAWLASPLIALWVSLPPDVRKPRQLRERQRELLRLTARRTWRFFEETVSAQDHDLPPDNIQEDPKPVVARRTSPTNIGVYVLSCAAARDRGWIGARDMLERIEATLATLEKLERFRGHFFNWYATSDLRPLMPKYISTVDSGNLAAHLLTLQRACLEISDGPPDPARVLRGVRDALALARPHLEQWTRGRHEGIVTKDELARALVDLVEAIEATRAKWPEHLRELDRRAATLADIAHAIDVDRADEAVRDCLTWVRAIRACTASHLRDVDAALAARAGRVADHARAIAFAMDFGFLYDPTRKLFAVGYATDSGQLDTSYYDLLASEARLASLLAIARGQVPYEHWFHLGRPLIPLARGIALASWSGSMFEYLMPDLVMRAPPHSLLAQTSRLIVEQQIRHGQERGVPWGMSESAFSGRDLALTYQYKAIGVAELGLRRGLTEDLVIAPYATALAAMVDAPAAAENFVRLAHEGARGALGFYEAIDFTPSRLQAGQKCVVVRAYMAHHQGMTLLALANVLDDGLMRERFHSEPLVKAAELLLQERTPHGVAISHTRARDVDTQVHVRDYVHPVLRHFSSPHDATPRTHLLSNGQYVVMLTTAGSGYSRFGDIAITRWREDPTRDDWGSYVFVGDVERKRTWSVGYQPSGAEPDQYEVGYFEDRAEIRRRDGPIATLLDVVVSSEDDAEVRQVSVTNLGLTSREIELTSYSEIVLATPDADAAHPAFSKLFVETEFVAGSEALLATRRSRSPDEPRIWAAHVLALSGEASGALQYETDRARFLGRGRTVRNAVCIREGRPLSGTVGSVLDPVFSLRRRITLAPGATARAVFSTLVAPTREALLALVDRYRRPDIFERTANLGGIL